MPPTDFEDVLVRARDARSMETLQESDRATLENIRDFLLTHEAESVRTATHTVLENFPDWWCKARRAPPGLMVDTEAELEELYKHMGQLHSMGMPLTLAEKRTPTFRFFQDVEAWGTRDESMPAGELICPESELALLIGRVIGEAFPGHSGFLDVGVYDASGLSQTKGVKKTSLRLVWPSIVVDSDRAAKVRDLVVHRLTAASAEPGPIADMETRLREFSTSNAWHSVFGDAAYGTRCSVRMPLCDRVSPLPLRTPERRPLNAVGVLRYSFDDEGIFTTCEWLCKQAELDGSEWIKIGGLRQPGETTSMTECTMPTYAMAAPIPQSSIRAGRVKVRTAGGSDNMVGVGGLKSNAALRTVERKSAPERAGQLLTVERQFNGSVEQFCEKMEQHLGKATVESDGSCVWKQPEGEARVVMVADDKRIKVIGRPNQVRSLVVIVSPYTEALQVIACPLAARQTHQPDGRAPSAAFAPASANEGYPAAAAEAVTTDKAEDVAAGAAKTDGQVRIVKQAFEAEGQGELNLAVGDAVKVTHDPEAEQGGGEDRWVYGSNEANGECGWFPISHTAEE